MIFLDENLDQPIISKIVEEYPDSISIKETYPGIEDAKIAELASRKNGIIITEDKDFGDLVFYHGFSGFSVILLRYSRSDRDKVISECMNHIKDFKSSDSDFFITITKNKIRIRKI